MASGSPLLHVDHRPYPLPSGRWIMRQRWNDLLFAHWPVSAAMIAALLPPTLSAGLEVDTFAGEAWVGVVPFWMDQVTERPVGDLAVQVPSVRMFSELNLRTYVRSRRSGKHGVYFFSLDCSSALAVLGARILFHLPYFFASMQRSQRIQTTHANQDNPLIHYKSRRILASSRPAFEATYAASGNVCLSQPGSLEAFLTERYCLFTHFGERILCGDIHHDPWPLQPAEAEIRINDIPAAHAILLPSIPPILHFSRKLEVFLWPLAPDHEDARRLRSLAYDGSTDSV